MSDLLKHLRLLVDRALGRPDARREVEFARLALGVLCEGRASRSARAEEIAEIAAGLGLAYRAVGAGAQDPLLFRKPEGVRR